MPDEERDAGGSVGQAVAAVSGEQLGGTSAEQWAARQRAPAEEGVTKRVACQEAWQARLRPRSGRKPPGHPWDGAGPERMAIKEDIGAVSKQT